MKFETSLSNLKQMSESFLLSREREREREGACVRWEDKSDQKCTEENERVKEPEELSERERGCERLGELMGVSRER